ncbi:proton myo-inositol cotransporter-like isoform X1, partial [Lates japonicus]
MTLPIVPCGRHCFVMLMMSCHSVVPAWRQACLVSQQVVSIATGIASMTVPVYIAEASPPHLRGQLVTVNTLFITGGQFTASLIDGAFSYMQHGGW